MMDARLDLVTISLREHYDALRAADERLQAERDRRTAQLREADQRALEIKQTADEKALRLADEIQKYKDEKANELREQINSERGLYITAAQLRAEVEKIEAILDPIGAYVAAQQGRSVGIQASTGALVTI